MTRTTAAAPADGASPFAGQFVNALIGVDLVPGARRPVFDEDVWDLRGMLDVAVQVRSYLRMWDFTPIPHPPWQLVAREYAIAVMAPHNEHVVTLPLARRTAVKPLGCRQRMHYLVRWFRWLRAEGVESLQQVTQEHCDRFLQLRWTASRTAGVMAEVVVIKDLARYGELFTADRYPPGFMPWAGKSAAMIAGHSCVPGENKTPAVPERLLRPALQAGLFLVDRLGPHVVELLDRLRARPARPTRSARHPQRDEFAALMTRYVDQAEPLPELDQSFVEHRLNTGWDRHDPLLRVNFGELAGDLGIRQFTAATIRRVRDLAEDAVGGVGVAPYWARHAVPLARADGAGAVAWTRPLTTSQVEELAAIVFNACLVVTAALTGMRSGEIMELSNGSCLPPRQLGPDLFRFSLRSKRIKGEPIGGIIDDWVVIEPAYRAFELAARLSATALVMTSTDPDTSVFGRYSFSARFDNLRRWVSGPAGDRLGLQPIPDDRITGRMLRRTLALELAQRPQGLLAAKMHLKHVSVATTEGYAARPGGSQARFHAEMVAEERAHHEQLTAAAYRDYQDGAMPAGPGAKSLIAAFQHLDAELATLEPTQPTVVATDRQIELLVKKRAATLHVQPANYCWFTDPTQALCLKLAGTPTATKPLAGLCDAARCPQATFHPEHRQIWAGRATATEVFLGNPRIPAGEKTRLAGEHARAQRVVDAIDQAIDPTAGNAAQ